MDNGILHDNLYLFINLSIRLYEYFFMKFIELLSRFYLILYICLLMNIFN